MPQVQFHTATVNAVVDDTNTALLYVVYSSGLTESHHKVSLGGYPLTLYRDDTGKYSLAVVDPLSPNVNAGNVADGDQNNYTTVWRRQKLAIAEVDDFFALGVIVDTGGTSDLVSTQTFRGMPHAVNENGSLVLTKVPYFDPDQSEVVSVGGNPLVVRRSGNNWYLVVATYVPVGSPSTAFMTLDEFTFLTLDLDSFCTLGT